MISWAFFAVACLGAVWTLVSYRPPRRPGVVMLPSFFAAWLTTELAPIHLVWQAVATIVFVALGALHAWPGWAGLGLTVVSWWGLTASIRGARQTDRLFADALRDALGDEIGRAHGDDERGFEWARVWLPFRFRTHGVERVANIQYVDDGTRRHRLDVYRPAGSIAGAPVLLQIHGGGWMIGSKEQQGLPLMYRLAARGWVCVAINYGLSPRATWPDQLVDCKRALAWIREHVGEYGGDPSFVVVTGGSAGGHLAALVGLTANDRRWQPGFEQVDTSVRAMVPIYGVFDWTGSTPGHRENGLRRVLERYIVKQPYSRARDVYVAASPVLNVHADAPPALVIHGTLDTLAPVADAREFVARLRAVSRQPVVYVELRGAHHAFEVFNSIRALHAIEGIHRFVTWAYGRPTPPGALSPGAADPTNTA